MDTLHFHTALPDAAQGAPDWVHLLPSGTFRGNDGRGPYRVADADALIAHSMQATGGRLPVDENHSTDRAQSLGGSAPAVGWIVELQSRADGIWGRVDWTNAGRGLLADRAYRGISPAFRAPGGRVSSIERASLTNLPNFSQLTQLHNQEQRMDLAEIRRRLSLADTASEGDVLAALERARDALSLHSRVAEIAGVAATVSADALITGLRARSTEVETHARQVAALEEQVASLRAEGRRAAATHFIEETQRARFISDEARDELLELHMENPERARKLAAMLPEKKPGLELHTRRGTPAQAEDELLASAARAWGQSPDDVRKMMKGAA